MYINSPEVQKVALTLFPNYKGRSFQVKVFHGPKRLRSCWEGGSITYWAMINLATGKTGLVPENGTPFTDAVGDLQALPVNCVLGEHVIFRGKDLGVRLHVHPDNLKAYQLEAPDDLSFDEKLVLVATRCFKPSYAGRSNNRLYEVQHEGFDMTAAKWETLKAGLIVKGYLNKAGAITDKGRNAASFEKYSSLYSVKREME